MTRPISWVFMVLVALGLASTASADACSDKCSVNFFGAKITDPVCVEICRKTGISPDPLPPLFPPLDPGEVLENICASKFEVWTTRMVAGCKLTSGFSSQKPPIKEATDLLISKGYFSQSEFEGVEFQFCNLPAGSGLAPNGKQVFLTQEARSWTSAQLAKLVAHEMHHIRQYREMGYNKFACDYVQQILKGNGTQCNNSLEKPAYDFECSVGKSLGFTNACTCAPQPVQTVPYSIHSDCMRATGKICP